MPAGALADAEDFTGAVEFFVVGNDFWFFGFRAYDDVCFSESAGNEDGGGFYIFIFCDCLDGFVEVFTFE